MCSSCDILVPVLCFLIFFFVFLFIISSLEYFNLKKSFNFLLCDNKVKDKLLEIYKEKIK